MKSDSSDMCGNVLSVESNSNVRNTPVTPPDKITLNAGTQRYGALDGLRTYAAIGIVLMHVLLNIGIKPSENYLTRIVIPWFTDYTLMFMVVSGFSLCCGYYERIRTGAITPNDFYKKRYMRILPFFACLCVLDFLVAPSIEQACQLFANLTLCFNFIPNANITMIGVGWFLGLVFVFYLLFPFFVFMLNNKRRAWISMVLALTFAWLCTVHSFNESIATPKIGRANIVYSMPLFMAGGLVYLYRDKLSLDGLKHRAWLFACILVTIVFFLFPEMRETGFGVLVSELLLFSVWLIYALGSRDLVLNNRFVRFVSGVSMEVYLCHMVMFRVVEKIRLERFFSDGNVLYILTCLLVIVMAIVFSWMMKRHVLPQMMKYVGIKG